MVAGMPSYQKAAEIVQDSGGQIIGRTRLQKVGYLLKLAGFEPGFDFEYRHYGPYSEGLAEAMRGAEAFDLVSEEERVASWGGFYSIFSATDKTVSSANSQKITFTTAAASISAIELELAATAAYLHSEEGCDDPWAETARRKPEKANAEKLEGAKKAYRQLLSLGTPIPLPRIV